MARDRNHISAQALIVLEDTSVATHGHRVDERWIWVREYEAHVWDGKPLSIALEPAKKGKPTSPFDRAWDEVTTAYRNTARVFRPRFVPCEWRNLEKACQANPRNCA